MLCKFNQQDDVSSRYFDPGIQERLQKKSQWNLAALELKQLLSNKNLYCTTCILYIIL